MLLSRRLIGLELSTLLRDLTSQMLTKVGQVPVWMLGHCGVCERLRSLLVSLIMNGLLECSHLCRGLVLRDRVGYHGLGFPQLVLQ